MSLLSYFLDDLRPTKRPRLNWIDELIPTSSSSVAIPRDLIDISDYIQNLRAALTDKDSKINVDKDKFQANFDVQHFKPEEVCVKVNEDKKTVTVEAKHEEKQDEHGHIFRHFVRTYTLPKDCDINHVESKISSDGVLSVTAPKVTHKRKREHFRSIPIIQTGRPVKSVENKKKDEDKMDTNGA